MVCVLSVMNGFGVLVQGMFSRFDPEIRVESTSGQFFDLTTLDIPEGSTIRYAEVLSGQALIAYRDHQIPCTILGVDTSFVHLTGIDSLITDGKFVVYDGAFDRCVMGRGLAAQLGVGAHFVDPIHIYVPHRTGRVNILRPDEAFCHQVAYMSGVFAVCQAEYDDNFLLIDIGLARNLLEADSTQVSALYVEAGGQTDRVQHALQAANPHLRFLNREQQHADFYRILRIEKLLTILLLAFILIIAAFNLVGSLAMLIIDKQNDSCILSDLGLPAHRIRSIFVLVGVLVTMLGAAIGLATGLALCLMQQHFGFISLGDGADYVISAYPVAVQVSDLLLVILLVSLIGLASAWIASYDNIIPTSD